MIEKGATEWNRGMNGACSGGHLDIVKFMISKGATDFNSGLCYASRRGYVEVVKFLLSQGATNIDGCLNCACLCGDLDFAKTMIEKGATGWDGGLIKACWGGHLNLVKLMIDCGATYLNGALLNNLTKNTNVSMLLINSGANDLDCLSYTRDFRLLYMYNKFIGTSCNNYMDLLSEYPPCVLFVGSRLSKSSCMKKLPKELFKVLVRYL